MNKEEIPTAEEFLQDSFTISHFYNDKYEQMMCFSDEVQKAMIEFAKFHVEAFKEKLYDAGISGISTWEGNPYNGEGSEYLDTDKISRIYPLENIK